MNRASEPRSTSRNLPPNQNTSPINVPKWKLNSSKQLELFSLCGTFHQANRISTETTNDTKPLLPNPLRFCHQLRVYRTLARQVCPSFKLKPRTCPSPTACPCLCRVCLFANLRSINLICLKYSHSPNRRSAKWTVMDDIIWSILDAHRPNAGLKYPFENTKAGIPGGLVP